MENLRIKGTIKVDRSAKLIEKIEPYDDLQHTSFTYAENPEKYKGLIKELEKLLEYRNFSLIEYGCSDVFELIDKDIPLQYSVYLLGHKSGIDKKKALGIRLTNSHDYKGYISVFINKFHYFSIPDFKMENV